MKIQIPDGWKYPDEPINWNVTDISEIKIIVDKSGCWHFLERI